MTLFAVMVTNEDNGARVRMKKTISEKFPEQQYLEVGDCLWFVDSQLATTQELSVFLSGENNENELSFYIVLPVGSYFGRHNKFVWEWLRAKGL